MTKLILTSFFIENIIADNIEKIKTRDGLKQYRKIIFDEYSIEDSSDGAMGKLDEMFLRYENSLPINDCLPE